MKKTLAAIALAGLTTITATAGIPNMATAAEPAKATSPADIGEESQSAVLEFDTAAAEGFTASVSQGTVTKNSDGSLTILNDQGEESAHLQNDVLLDDGTTRTISYEIDDATITASYDAPITAGQQPLSLQGDGVTCGISVVAAGGAYLGAAGAALTAPLTFGGGLVVAGAALTAGAGATNAAYQCYG